MRWKFRCETVDCRLAALPAGLRQWRVVLNRRRTLCPGRRRGLHYCRRDGSDGSHEVSDSLREAARKNIQAPRFSHSGYFNDPKWAAPRNFVGTMGMPIKQDGSNDPENLNLATRNAILQMIDLLAERGYTREQAYCICSVAVDLRISNVVDVPNFVVSALLPEEIFVK